MTISINRDIDRGRLAADKVRASGGSALQAAEAAISAAFNESTKHEMLKRRVRFMMHRAADDSEWLRYKSVADRMPTYANLEAVLWLTLMERRIERQSRAASIARWGHSPRPRLAMKLLDEVVLMLRWARRYAPEEFQARWEASQ